jgi:hypothetical protein
MGRGLPPSPLGGVGQRCCRLDPAPETGCLDGRGLAFLGTGGG